MPESQTSSLTDGQTFKRQNGAARLNFTEKHAKIAAKCPQLDTACIKHISYGRAYNESK